MKKFAPLAGLISGFAVVLLIYSSAFIIQEGRQVVVTQFGKPVGEPITEAGLHFKLPLIQELRYVDKRILSWDGDPNEVRTGDNKFIKVDTTARYKIFDALKFIQTVENSLGAKTRLDTVLDAATRDVISNHKLVETVRNSNDIIQVLEERKSQKTEDSKLDVEEEITGEIEQIEVGREALSELIAEQAESKLQQFGIELVDVQLRRIAYEESVEQKVYERMISERERIAQKLRSVGKGEQAIIEGRTQKDLRKIESEAYRKVQIILGEAESEAIKIYASSVGRDPDLYEFLRTLDAYEKALDSNDEFILSTDSEFFRTFARP